MFTCRQTWVTLVVSQALPLWLKSSVSSVSAEVITAEDSVGSWLRSLAMVVTLRRSVWLSHSATDRPGKSAGSETESSTCNTSRTCQLYELCMMSTLDISYAHVVIACLVFLAPQASWAIQKHDFVGLQGSGNGSCNFCWVQHRRATSPVHPHRTNQWDGPTVQTPL